MQSAESGGKRRLLVGGRVNRYIANPTFDPVSTPGALYHWYRGNPEGKTIVEAFGELEPIRPAYRDRDARLDAMDAQGVGATLMFPTLGVGLEEALKDDPDAGAKVFHAFNRWVEDDWGFRYRDRLFAVPYVPMLDPRATHAGLDGYDVIVDMWEDAGPESSIFRSPLRGLLTKGRAVTDFYGAALCQLLFERFPGLRMASVENGAGWIPDLLHRLEDAANRNPGYFRDDPVASFLAHVWVTPFWEDDVQVIAASVPVDRLLLGSDWPHAEGVVEPLDFVTESLALVDGPTVRRIARDNAAELIGVDVP